MARHATRNHNQVTLVALRSADTYPRNASRANVLGGLHRARGRLFPKFSPNVPVNQLSSILSFLCTNSNIFREHPILKYVFAVQNNIWY